jgi:hypothetical protein
MQIIDMKKGIILTLILFLGTFHANAQKAEQIYSRVTIIKSNEYYAEQANIWKETAASNPKNANAWFNYYKAKRNIQTLKQTDNVHSENRFKELNEIVNQVNKYCPNSFEAHYLIWKNSNSNPTFFKELNKAYEIDSNRTDYFPDFVIYHEIMGNHAQRNFFLKKLAKSDIASPGLLNYAYNMLIGLDSNSIIITAGDNDTYYPWLIQEAYGIRKDVKVINIHLAYKQNVMNRYATEIGIETINVEKMNFNAFQFQLFQNLKQLKIAALNSMNGTSKIEFNTSEKKLADIVQEPKKSYYQSRYKSGGLYFNTTFQFDSFPFDDYLKLNLVGLSYEYQLYPSGVQALNKLIQNYDQHFQLDYMKHTFCNDISQSMVDFVNGNYLPSLYQLYEHFEKTDVSKALKYKKLAFEIARKSNQLNEVQALMGKE